MTYQGFTILEQEDSSWVVMLNGRPVHRSETKADCLAWIDWTLANSQEIGLALWCA